jgi:2-polyprenyl-3-methyl-5-hydroxy-6-metoxy-1,4-benzoquinol methylase
MTFTSEEIEAGQAVYSKEYLYIYDTLVLGLANRFVWRCPTQRILNLYDRHVTANHLDVGIGTGYFLDRCKFPTASPRVTLIDLNATSLQFSARRIARYRPETYLRNILEPLALDIERFDSVEISYLLHCLPGSMPAKGMVLDHLKALMNTNGVLFGATIVQDGIQRNFAARPIARMANLMGIFSNGLDYLDGLKTALTQRFRDVSIDLSGCAALFSARV